LQDGERIVAILGRGGLADTENARRFEGERYQIPAGVHGGLERFGFAGADGFIRCLHRVAHDRVALLVKLLDLRTGIVRLGNLQASVAGACLASASSGELNQSPPSVASSVGFSTLTPPCTGCHFIRG
jgi:hypothetical protein